MCVYFCCSCSKFSCSLYPFNSSELLALHAEKGVASEKKVVQF